MKNCLFTFLIIFCSLAGNAQTKPAEYVQVPVFTLCADFEDTLKNILHANSVVSADSCLMIHVNTMDSTGKLVQVVVLPQQRCIAEIYDFYIDETFGIAMIDSIIVCIYGRSHISSSLAVKTNSSLFVKVKTLNRNTSEQSDEYFPKTFYIDFRDAIMHHPK